MDPRTTYVSPYGPVEAGRPGAPPPPPIAYSMPCMYCGATFPTPQLLQTHLASPVHTMDVWADVQDWRGRKRRRTSHWGPRWARHLLLTLMVEGIEAVEFCPIHDRLILFASVNTNVNMYRKLWLIIYIKFTS